MASWSHPRAITTDPVAMDFYNFDAGYHGHHNHLFNFEKIYMEEEPKFSPRCHTFSPYMSTLARA